MCGEGKSDLFTAWFTNDDLLLVNSVGSISKLGNIEALVLNLVLALNLGDLNSFGDTDLLGGRVGQGARLLQWDSDEGEGSENPKFLSRPSLTTLNTILQ